jgi:flagellar protein FliS
MNNQLKTYQQMHISGLNQQELIVLLYSGALRFIEDGKELLKTGDVPKIHEKLDKARNIFIHLLATLNMEAGGEFAQKLSALYAYFIEKITVANVTKDAKELDDIIPLIQEIKESWEKIDIKDQAIPNKLKTSSMKPTQVFSAEV